MFNKLEDYVDKMRSNWKLREGRLANPNLSVNEEKTEQALLDRPGVSSQSINYGDVEYEEEDVEEEISCGFSNPIRKSSTVLKEVELCHIDEYNEKEYLSEGISPLKQEIPEKGKKKEDIIEKIPETRTLKDIAEEKHLLKNEPDYIPPMPATIVPVKIKQTLSEVVEDRDDPDSESPIDDLLTVRYSRKIQEDAVPAKKKHKWLDSILN